MRRVATCWLVLAVFAGPAFAQRVVKEEPPMGTMKLGEKVLVDNGKCPKGQILEVTGGDHRKVGGTQMVERTRRCIPR